MHVDFKEVLKETRIGLGLDEDPHDRDTPLFDAIDDIYFEWHEQNKCYFHGPIDGLAEEMGKDTYICMDCRIKLGNFLTALGIPQSLVFIDMGQNKTQKTSITLWGAGLKVVMDAKPEDAGRGDGKNLH